MGHRDPRGSTLLNLVWKNCKGQDINLAGAPKTITARQSTVPVAPPLPRALRWGSASLRPDPATPLQTPPGHPRPTKEPRAATLVNDKAVCNPAFTSPCQTQRGAGKLKGQSHPRSKGLCLAGDRAMVIRWPTPPGTPCSGELGAGRPKAWGPGWTGRCGHAECQEGSGHTGQVQSGSATDSAETQL